MFLLLVISLLFYMNSLEINEKNNSKIKAAIFDLDGTLIDTQKFYDEANQIIINSEFLREIKTILIKKLINMEMENHMILNVN